METAKQGGITPSQTVGPFYAYCLTPARYAISEIFSNDLTRPGLDGDLVRIEGRVLDGDGVGVVDAMLEFWQADARGRFDHALGGRGSNIGFKGFGRVEPTFEGTWSLTTIRPGRVATKDGVLQAPHIDVAVFARGMLRNLTTRIYFSDEAANVDDPVLNIVPAERRETLIARKEGDVYRFDIRLQESADGAETVFFAC